MTFASYVTITRIVLILPIIYLTSLDQQIFNNLALCIFLFAGLTDYLDGYIARRTQTESSLGALLDLLADKLLVCIVLLWLVVISNQKVLIFPVLIIISRELIVSSVRQAIVEKLGINPIKVSYIAKSKTTMQFIAISFLIVNPGYGTTFNLMSVTLVWLAAFLSIYSLVNYLKSFKDYF
tara:strand:- start:28 stop:567 length:540 start_codon:yes stop_codon:yes gene_type:complete